ncbi:hypothetical protein [uncultured Algoriphagus sp.]|uniref:hypothetical protein n=1 Tax=uncultured Algoriphagus sp. TaxID=417365 RepID=UPI002599D709|nr:hypothetical protein [uncultured Algoriphagus sp.]
MKKLSIITLVILSFSCSIADDTNQIQENPQIEDVLTSNNPNASEPSNPPSSNEPAPNEGEAWRIHLVVEDGFDVTKNFKNVRLFFDESGSLEARLGDESISGRWRIESDSPRDELYLDFPNGTILKELDDDWYIIDLGETEIVLEYKDDEYESELVLIKGNQESSIVSPFSGQEETSVALFSKVSDNSFGINSYMDDDDNKTQLFDGGRLVFDDWGQVTFERDGQDPIKGIWLVGFNDQNVLLDLDFPSQGLGDYLDEEWLLQSKSETLLQLIEKDEDDRDRMELILR